MRDERQRVIQALGIRAPWEVSEIELDLKAGEVKVYVEPRAGAKESCPQCGVSCPGFGARNMVSYRYGCHLPAAGRWAEPGSGFSALYEALVIDWLKEASIQAVSRQLGLSWNAVDGIMQRAVKRGLGRSERNQVRWVDQPEKLKSQTPV